MQITSYNRNLADGSLETDPETGLPVVYSMGGEPDDRLPDDAVNVTTGSPDTPMDDIQRAAQIEASASAWDAMLAATAK